MTAKQVDELIMDKENRDKKEYESKIEEKGYKRGLKEGKVQSDVESNKEVPQEENPEKEEMVQQLLSDNEQMENALNSQTIPDEVIEELLALAQNDPETFQEVVQAYPQIAEMLQEDMMNMNGGQI